MIGQCTHRAKVGNHQNIYLEDLNACNVDTAQKQKEIRKERMELDKIRFSFWREVAANKNEKFVKTQTIAESRQD